MTQQRSSSQQAYCQTVGTSPTGSTIIEQRDPTPNDVNYKIGQFWLNQSSKSLWYLNSQTSLNATLQSVWELISVESLLASISDTANTPVFASLSTDTPPDNIQLVGGSGISIVSTPASHLLTITNTGAASDYLPDTGTSPVTGASITVTNTSIVATGTLANAIRSNGTGASTIAYQVQYAGSNASTSAVSKWGVAQFDSNQFTVTSGFVQLAGGGGAPTLGIVPDAHTAPGTTPVVPNGSGNIILEGGATFATGTQSHPIRTNSLAANTIDLQIQLAGSNAASSTPNDFGVSQFDANQFTVTSGFVQIKNSGTTGVVTEVIGDDGLAVVPAAGTGAITLDGITVVSATNAKPVFFKKNATNTEELDVQLTTTSTSGAKNINKSGLAHFDSASFTVDASTGFVQLTGGGSALETLTGNSGGAIPPTANNINTVGTGSITIAGSGSTLTTQLTGLTNHAVLVGAGTATITNVGPTSTIGQVLQSAGASADPAFSTATYPLTTTINQILYSSSTNTVTGLATTNSSSLVTSSTGVPTWIGPLSNGQVVIGSTGAIPVASTLTAGTGITITNGAGSITVASTNGTPVTAINLDAGTSPINPNASGVLVFTGAQVATGVVGTNVIRTDGTAANTMAIQIQRSTTSAISNVALNGVCHFDSSKFSVDANGFVTFTGSTSNIPWTDEGGNFNAASNNGYFCTAVLTATLPPTPGQGDVVRLVVDTASVVTVTANTGQKIRIGNVISALAGTAASTKQGDSLDLVYRASSATWYEVGGAQGSWSIT